MGRLEDILHEGSRLYLVFEYMHMDLKKYMDSLKGKLDPMLVKVKERSLIDKSLRGRGGVCVGSGCEFVIMCTKM